MRPLAIALLVLAGCDTSNPIATTSGVDAGVACEPAATTESQCSDGLDDDCDGFADCLDPDCEGNTCGGGGALTCTAGACLMPCTGGDSCLPEVPRIDNVRVTTHGDTAIIEFEPVAGAQDYRVYVQPEPADILVGADGEVAVRDAIYRCGGDRPIGRREDDPAAFFQGTFVPDAGPDRYQGYARTEEEALLGYVYLTPAAGRSPVYRVANPDGAGGYWNHDWVVPTYTEAAAADYVVGVEARDALLAAGWRDDGIVFYVPDDGDRTVYRRLYEPEDWGDHIARFYTAGPEYDARAEHDDVTVEFGERFAIASTQSGDAVPLYRLSYQFPTFDVLAAGEARFDRAVHQGSTPVWYVAWPGLTGPTTLVVEALDAGCPFPGGYIGAHHADADVEGGTEINYPTLTLDEARLSSGEVYINGQHDPSNRPRPIARAYVEVSPEPDPEMDFFEGFDPGDTWAPLTEYRDNNSFLLRNEAWAIDTSGCSGNFSQGPVLGQFMLGMTDYGSSCNVSIVPRQVQPQISAARFLHVRMSTDIPSTGRRYPQMMITTAQMVDESEPRNPFDIALHNNIGPLFDDAGTGHDQTIIVQPFGGYMEMQVEFCDQRGWGVNTQCPHANIYGHHAGDYDEDWELPWTPMPVIGELAGFDRPVQLDVYASTERVYVFVDERPAGCAILPPGRMPAGDVTVAFRAVAYHSAIDETITSETAGRVFEREYSLMHSDRRMDDFGIDMDVPAPVWDESRLPCGERWYGGG